MINIVHDSILNSKENLICHQVNCRRVMNKGLAKQVREKFPNVWEAYKHLCAYYPDCPWRLLGTAQVVEVSETQYIVNIFGQDNYGSDKAVYTNTDALDKAFKSLAKRLKKTNESIAFPYKIGCGLGGGDWNKVQSLIVKHFSKYNVTLYVQGENFKKIKW